ncbi:MAG: hypothetical protein U9P71_06630 [Campylobacterota bacterium]|nr:hypothetical protein [Campylobacterota bacterium]
MRQSSILVVLIFMLSACGSDSSAFVDRGVIVKSCEEVKVYSGDSVVSNTPDPNDTLVIITHNLDNKKTLKVLKGEVKLTRAN